MRRLMKYTVVAAIVASGPLMAQEGAPSAPGSDEAAATSSADMTPEQLRAYGLWPDERRAMFDGWPAETQTYYWTLTPPRQEVFWMLSESDRVTLTGMTDEDKEQTWQRLEQQMLASQPPVGSQPTEPSTPDAPTEPVPMDPEEAPMPGGPEPMPAEEAMPPEPMAEVQDHSPR